MLGGRAGLVLATAILLSGWAAAADRSAARDGAPFEIVEQKFPEPLAQGPARGGVTWIPHYVEMRSLQDRPVVVEISASLRGGEGKKEDLFAVRRRIEVARGAPTRAWLYLRVPPLEGTAFRVRATCRAEGTTLALPDASFTLLGGDSGETEAAMVVTGERTSSTKSPWGDDGPTIGRKKVVESRIVRFEEKALPDRWIGYSRANLLLLRSPDFRALEPAQIEAIRRWAFLGGRVVVVPSLKGEVFDAPLVRSLLGEAEIGEPRAAPGFVPGGLWIVEEEKAGRIAKAEEVDTIEGGKSFTIVDPVKVETVREIVSAGDEWEAGEKAPPGAVRLYGEVAYGRGRVGFLTFDDLAIPAAEALPFRQALWGAILGSNADQPSAAPIESGREEGIAAAIREGLTRDLGVWFIALLVVAYLLVIGPGTYLVLRRMGKLPAIVWVEPIIVVLYIGIIAATAYITKGVLTKVRMVTVIDHVQGEPYSLQRSWLGLFSAGDERYRIAAPGKDGIEPVGGGGEEMDGIDLDLDPATGPAIRSWHVAQWATAVFAAGGLAETPPGSEVAVTVETAERDGGRIEAEAVTVSNGTLHAFRRTFIRTGSGDLYLGPAIPPGGEARIEAPFTPVNPAPAMHRPRAAGEKEIPDPADPLGGDGLLRAALGAQMGGGGERGAAIFVGEIDRDERDFTIDRASTVDRRVDLYVERQ